MKIICFDLEGPISPQDNAYEVMRRKIKDGDRIFEILSRYDDILAVEKRANYEPGDTLSLIVPFLICHGISKKDVEEVSNTAGIVDGIPETIRYLKEDGWKIYVISTSYEQHAFNIGKKIGIEKQDIYCTRIDLDSFGSKINTKEREIVKRMEKDMLKLCPPVDDEKIRTLLDRFFGEDLAGTAFEAIMKKVVVVGGARKTNAVRDILKKNGAALSDVIVVGDSITDYKMLSYVGHNGGISIAFNSNEYALPHATVGLATRNMESLRIIIDAYDAGGKERIFKTAKEWEMDRESFAGDPSILEKRIDKNLAVKIAKNGIPYLNLISDKADLGELVKIHKKIRNAVRGAAGKLG